MRILKYWFRILTLRPPLVYDIYKMLLDDTNNGKTNWVSNVKNLLCNLGFNELWILQNPGSFSIDILKQRIKDQFLQSWVSGLDECTKLNIYKHFKIEFCMESYLDFHINVQLLTKIRSGTLKLSVETGRYQNLERENRICFSCNMNVVEDEYHFVLVCPTYRSLRKLYLPIYYCSWPNRQKLYNLLICSDRKLTTKVCMFINSAWKLRSQLILTS